MGLGEGLQVDVGLCGLLNAGGAGAVLWAVLAMLLLSTRSRLSSRVNPLSWLRLRLTGYTVGALGRSFVMCLNLSSLLRWG